MKKILIAFFLVLTLTGMLFAAGQGETKAEGSTAPALKVWAVKAAEVPVNLETVPNWKEVEKATGVKLSWDLISTQVKEQKFNLLMASGELPDIVAYYEGKGGHSSINRFGEEGAFIPLEDLIRKYAPNLKKTLLENREIKDMITAQDGHIYFVPMLAAIKAARGWYIRYDWLDKLGLKIPKTTDELYKVLVAFRDRDPNGNGKKDEIPLVFRRRGDDAFYNIQAFAYAFDADMAWVLRGNKVHFGPAEPQYKDYLAYINKLYSAKLIDQEVLTRPGNPRNELFGKNLAGCIHDWFASTASLNDTLKGKIPGFNLRHMPPPVGTAKKAYTRIQMSRVRKDGGWAITFSDKNPVETIKMMDFIYSKKGIILTNFGVEGRDYAMVNGEPVYTDLIKHNPNGLGFHESLVSEGCQWKIGMVQDINYEKQFANKIAFAARKDYQDNYIIDAFPMLSFTEDETNVLKDKYSQIRSYVLENTAKFMVGARPLADFDKFVKELNDMGLKDVTAIYQKAYERKFKK